jgi:hypothetical protein
MKEKEEKRDMEDGEGASKRDYLKVLGAGLGIAGLSSMMGDNHSHKMIRRENMLLLLLMVAMTRTEPYWASYWLKRSPIRDVERYMSG